MMRERRIHTKQPGLFCVFKPSKHNVCNVAQALSGISDHSLRRGFFLFSGIENIGRLYDYLPRNPIVLGLCRCRMETSLETQNPRLRIAEESMEDLLSARVNVSPSLLVQTAESDYWIPLIAFLGHICGPRRRSIACMDCIRRISDGIRVEPHAFTNHAPVSKPSVDRYPWCSRVSHLLRIQFWFIRPY